MCLRTEQKRIQMIKKGVAFDLNLNIIGNVIKEQKNGVLLGLNWYRDLGCAGHIEQTADKYNNKVGGILKVCPCLDFKHRKQ